MGSVIRFSGFYRVLPVAGDAVYLASERFGQVRLAGALTEALAPLLAGQHDRAGVIEKMDGEFSRQRVERVLDELIAAGHVVETDPGIDPRAGGYWEMAGLRADAAVSALESATVTVAGVGNVGTQQFVDAAASCGLRIGTGPGSLRVVLTDDYLRPELSGLGRESLAGGWPWMLIKPVGAVVWVGPVFEPGVTGCYACLRAMLADKDRLESFLWQRGVLSEPLAASVTELPAATGVAAGLGALLAAKWITGLFARTRELWDRHPEEPRAGAEWIDQSEVITFDTVTFGQARHKMRRRPQCPECGDPAVQADRQRRPVELVSRPKAHVSDGGHRSADPQAFLNAYESLVSPVTGPVSNLTRGQLGVSGLHAYVAGHNQAVAMRDVDDLRVGLRSMSAGKGFTDVQARASALAEGIERYSVVWQGDEARITASYRDLGADAIEPNEWFQFSERQFAEREAWNRRGSRFNKVGIPLDPGLKIEWTPLWSLTQQRPRYLPTAGLFFGYGRRARGGSRGYWALPDSNGNAAGTSLEDAVVQGFLELVERDAVALWWYNMVRRPAIDLATFDEPLFEQWQQQYRVLHRDTWVLDLTNDLGIPAVTAVSCRTDQPVLDVMLGFGAHFDVKIAIGRAMCEMNQHLPWFQHDAGDAAIYRDPDHITFRTATHLEEHGYLLPASGPACTAGDYHDPSGGDLLDDVRLARKIVEGKGLEMLVLDQTRVDIGLPVVKVVVPGLRHFWRRLAPGRLYDMPAELGWIDSPRAESELNPIAMFL
ncbi:MAG TPA: TOMM precursor leader peptide-binding protein [Streptosporangiaceae bacterium]